jgi:hypothetical protein
VCSICTSAEDDDFRNKVQGNDVRGMGVAGRMYYYYYFYRYGMILYSKKVVIVSGRGISRS